MTATAFQQTEPGIEEQLVEQIRQQPTSRAAMISLARHFDSMGSDEEARSVYRGQLPSRLIGQFRIARLNACHSRDSVGAVKLKRYAAEIMTLTPPGNLDSRRNTIFTRTHTRCPPEYVDLVSDCSFYFDGVNSLTLNQAGQEISDHSSVNACLLHDLVPEGRQHSNRLSGLTLNLLGRNDQNFYHWFHDYLPKLGMLEACGIGVGDIHNFIVRKSLTAFQRESLRQLGIRENQLVYTDDATIVIQCEKLLLPKLHNKMGMSQSRRHLLWLRRSNLIQYPSADTEHPTGSRKIAIWREQRGFENSEEIYRHLKYLDYRMVRCEQLPLERQISLFLNATHVLSPHGAALALLAFCSPGTEVHEFYGSHVHPCFWGISCANRLNYHNYNCSLVSNGEITTSNKGAGQRKASNLDLDLELLKSISL